MLFFMSLCALARASFVEYFNLKSTIPIATSSTVVLIVPRSCPARQDCKQTQLVRVSHRLLKCIAIGTHSTPQPNRITLHIATSCWVVIAEDTLTHRAPAPPTVRSLDAMRCCNGEQGRHAVSVLCKNPLMHFSPTRARRSRAKSGLAGRWFGMRIASISDQRRSGQPVARSALLPVAVSVGLRPTRSALRGVGAEPQRSRSWETRRSPFTASGRHRSGTDSVSSLLTRFCFFSQQPQCHAAASAPTQLSRAARAWARSAHAAFVGVRSTRTARPGTAAPEARGSWGHVAPARSAGRPVNINADYAKRRAGAALAAHRLFGAQLLRKRRDRGPRKVALHFAGWVQTGGLHNPALCWDCNTRSVLGRVARERPRMAATGEPVARDCCLSATA